MSLTFEQKVHIQTQFHRLIGERQAAEFAVHLQESIDGLQANNDTFVAAYRKSAAEQSVHLTAFGAGWRARLGNWLVSLGNRIAQSGGK